MKKIFFVALLCTAMLTQSCQTDVYDDSSLRTEIDDLKDRVTTLEELCEQINTNISSLQTIVTALQNKVTVSEVDETANGYIIRFSDGTTAIITNGQNGDTPEVGAKQHTDGFYYWTIDGDWMLDDDGKKIRAEAQDGATGATGQNGVTPLFKIENGNWYLSTDNGNTWQNKGQATGDDGKDGEDGDSFFKSVTQDDDNVYFQFADDSIIIIPRETALDITFNNTSSINVLPDNTYEVEYVITGADATTKIEVVAQDRYKAHVLSTDHASGKIIVKTPSADLESSRVLVFVSKGTNTIMRILNFVKDETELSFNIQLFYDRSGRRATVAENEYASYALDDVHDITIIAFDESGQTLFVKREENPALDASGTYKFNQTLQLGQKTLENVKLYALVNCPNDYSNFSNSETAFKEANIFDFNSIKKENMIMVGEISLTELSTVEQNDIRMDMKYPFSGVEVIIRFDESIDVGNQTISTVTLIDAPSSGYVFENQNTVSAKTDVALSKVDTGYENAYFGYVFAGSSLKLGIATGNGYYEISAAKVASWQDIPCQQGELYRIELILKETDISFNLAAYQFIPLLEPSYEI